jgi:Mlc titration factor MtfA (ptsG expression regulator)
MTGVWIVVGVMAVVLGVGLMHGLMKVRRRRAVAALGLSDAERAVLMAHVPLLNDVPRQSLKKLEGRMRVFLDEISFEACGGLEKVTDEMRLAVAGQACLLLVESGYEDFGRLRSVLVYPDAYRAAGDDEGADEIRLGESWQTGSVVLSWQSVEEGAENTEDGRNVVLHEFAHQIDQYDGDADGLPILKRKGDYRRWARAFSESYEELCDRVGKGKKTVMDPYGATNPAEFFAVATETFFEKPVQMRREHPEVYEELRQFYGLNPAIWGR